MEALAVLDMYADINTATEEFDEKAMKAARPQGN
jgi:hypothetical protein